MERKDTSSKAAQMRQYREDLKKKKKEKNRETYNKNKSKYLKQKKDRTLERLSNDKKAKYEELQNKKRGNCEKRDEMRKRAAERQRKSRLNKKQKQSRQSDADITLRFNSKMEKSRALKKLRNSLPKTPIRKATILDNYLKTKSPTVELLNEKGIIQSPEDIKDGDMAKAMIEDMREIIQSTSKSRCVDARATIGVVSAVVNGKGVAKRKCRKRLSTMLGFTQRRMKKAHHKRTTVLKSDSSAWTYTEKQTRCTRLSTEDRERVYNFWLSPEISRPTGNKSDVKRVRLDVNVYSAHMKHVLLKTQAEAYTLFKKLNPNMKISIRVFERLKPFFITAIRPKDRDTCCCKQHVEAKMVFRACMDFRNKYSQNNAKRFESLGTLVDSTLCDNGNEVHQLKCVKKECGECGVWKLEVGEEELDDSDEAPDIEWNCYEYVTIKVKGVERKKISLVKKTTKPKVLFEYFISIIGKFSSHRFRSQWQANQLLNLKQTLPENDVICIHDFSENYTCKEQVEIQSDYFMRPEVSLHVTVIYRHWLPSIDGEQPDGADLVEEQFFCISEDKVHDHHFTHAVQEKIVNYLKSINYKVHTIHEWTDGCAAQYKSRHCLGDLSYASQDFGVEFTRSYFETSHAKGVQDAAGGLVKNMADRAVTRGGAKIQNAKDLHTYCNNQLTTVKKSGGCKRRIFELLHTIDRSRTRHFKPVPSIRSIHQVIPTEDGQLKLKHITCTCSKCLENKHLECSEIAKQYLVHRMLHEQKSKSVCENDVGESHVEEIVYPGSVIALYTDDVKEHFYMVQCVNSASILNEQQSDSWGNVFERGSHVIEGLYFEKHGRDVYKLIPSRPVLFPVMSVLYVIAAIPSNNDCVTLDKNTKSTIITLCREVRTKRQC